MTNEFKLSFIDHKSIGIPNMILTGKYLLELGQSLEYLLHVAMQKAGIEALKYTVLSGVMSAVAWPVGILALSHAIDNPW